ncbi:MAG: sensor histidine kinase [Spirochaetaceae bacterium]|jgi:signal transduction histidine kinase|nr:sensor histidine kinase [Spirochaetaceae bacterium]
MKSLFDLYAGVLLLCLLPGKGFAAGTGVEAPMSAYEVSQKWMNMETELLNYVSARPPSEVRPPEEAGPPAAEKLLAALDDFSKSVDGFLQSPLYESGRLTPFSQTDTTGNITPLIGELERAIRAGQTGAVLNLSGEIRKELARWLYLDSAMADTIHLKYFYQFIVLITLIVIMSVLVWRLTVSLEKARVKGKESAAFSRQVVLGQEQERSRIARELHDSVAQELSVLEMKVSQILYRVGPGDPSGEIQALCSGLSAGHTELIARIRAICNDLAPPEFRHQGLADALRKLCYDFEKAAGIECRITVPEGFSAGPMPVQMQLQCFRLVQEALANIRKHAEAKEATVVLRNADYGGKPALLICVCDDGKGFAPPQSAADTARLPSPAQADSPGHFGIRGMYERIAILGGRLSFISEEGEGTMVKIEAPLV